MAQSVKYTYRANGFYLSTGSSAGFRIVSINDSEMRIVKRVPSVGGGQALSLYCVYRKMADGELPGTRRPAGNGSDARLLAAAPDGLQ